MADVTIGTTVSLTSAASLNVRPPTNVEWIIHNIYVPSGYAIELYRWNDTGTTPQILITKTSVSMGFLDFHVTQDDFLIIKNISGSTIYVSYDGVLIS